jgi:hypothetical protein
LLSLFCFCHSYGLKVVAPLFGDGTAIATYNPTVMEQLLANLIDEVGNHSALLMWIYGNELGLMERDAQFLSRYLQYLK